MRPLRGYVNVEAGARWLATLTVPTSASRVAFIDIERRGDLRDDYRGREEKARFSLPIDEGG